MKTHYDIVVVGGGPAGSTAARYAAEQGASVVLLEKDREIGVPVRCAEGVGEKGLSALIAIQPQWIAQRITGAVLHAPSGAAVQLHTDEFGYVLHRKIFDYDLAQMAAGAGVEVYTKAYVQGLVTEADEVAGVVVEHMGVRQAISARLVIAADGVESRVGRWAGLDTRCSMRDIETCAQVTIGNYEGDASVCHFFFSSELLPGGYGWIFPKGNGMANVGLGISGDKAHSGSPHERLQIFLRQVVDRPAILTRVYGSVPCAVTLKKIVRKGLMLVGDAAHQANPLTGGGIVTGMAAAEIAGRVAAAAITEHDVSAERLQEYARLWGEGGGAKMNQFYRLKKFAFTLSDDTLNGLAKATLDLSPEKRTMTNIFKAALINKPSLILDAIKLFT